MKVYTKTGDQGTSGLIGGTRVNKDDLRLESYGTVDELSSFIGVLVAEGLQEEDAEFCLNIQHRLFKVGAYLATDQSVTKPTFANPIPDSLITEVECEIDRIVSLIPPLHQFVIPGGNKAASQAHVCRTICRRAERNIIRVSHQYDVRPNIIMYLNRLSDYFFVLARKCCTTDCSEIFWDNTK